MLTSNLIFEPVSFYSSYLNEYHSLKITALKKMLDDVEKYNKDFFDGKLSEDQKDQFKKMIQADIRQTYFHSIETFFELFFALNPLDSKFIGDKNIMIALTQSEFWKSYKRIEEITGDDKALAFLDDIVTHKGINKTVAEVIDKLRFERFNVFF